MSVILTRVVKHNCFSLFPTYCLVPPVKRTDVVYCIFSCWPPGATSKRFSLGCQKNSEYRKAVRNFPKPKKNILVQ